MFFLGNEGKIGVELFKEESSFDVVCLFFVLRFRNINIILFLIGFKEFF